MLLSQYWKKIRKKLKPLDERTREFDYALADESYQQGYQAGYIEGCAIGKAQGRAAGHKLGYETGYQDGRKDMAEYMVREA